MEINSTRNAHLLTASSTEAFPTKLRVAAIFRNPTFNNIFFFGGGGIIRFFLKISSKCLVKAFQNFVANIKSCYLGGYFPAVEINFRILCIWIFSGVFPDVITQCVRRYMLAGLVNKHEKFIIFGF